LTALGFTQSNKEAKRKIEEGAVRLDHKVVTENFPFRPQHPVKISLGKKKHAILLRGS
jgi:tyrosyl-tRNA synthetase